MSRSDKTYYVLGYITGALAMGKAVAYDSGYMGLLGYVKAVFPTYNVGSYIAFIDGVYEDERYHEVPLYSLILEADYWTEHRFGKGEEDNE
jgi:hypothetical protein